MSRRTLTRFAVPATLVTACALIASGCSSGDSGPNASAPSSFKTVAQINAHPVSDLKQGGNLNYPISQVVANYNYDDVNGASVDLNNIYEASMPTPEKADADGSVHTDTDYFTSIDSATVNGKFTVTYNINPKAKWSNGRPIDWTDLKANWNAQNGKDTTYEIAASNGYDQIESVVRGTNDQQAVVTYTKPRSTDLYLSGG
ncbi:hypothetical protein GCM10027169_16520 [Gordonia jinhuaensis]|uniref:Solute-binding protein family 5 domain-containing protein n=1 Tax=Gordonia jinhuaensis TaxID=1517702 RepID=A0A916TKS3_9ACTN|nr:ABC transporter substrate-binding protein [Gordonia jinhuaensis]GGB48297.1 hypothetical protein GCM10011489_39280 [Gordonia jinhuaensis]